MNVTGDAEHDMWVRIEAPKPAEPKPAVEEKASRKVTAMAADFFQEVGADAMGKASASAAIGVVLRVLNLALAFPFLGHASGMLVGRLVFNGSKHYNEALRKSLTDLGMRTWDFVKENPYVRIGTFATAVILTHIWPLVGFILGVALGALTALTIDLEQCSKRQKVKDAAEGGDSLGSIIDQWI